MKTNNSHHGTTPNWRLTLLNRAIRQALPLLIGATCLIIAKPAGANTSVNVRNVIDTTTIVRRFALTSQLERVGTNIGTKVRNQRAPGMGGVNNLNVGDGIIIGQMPRVDNRAIAVDRKLGLPLRDAAGRPLGYCAWDITSTTPVTDSETGRVLYLPGATGNDEMLTFAVVSAGQNGRLETGCADVLSRFNVNPEANLASGDDLVYASASIEQASSLFASPVDTRIELDALPSAELNEVRFVNDQNAFYVYKGAGPGWVIVSGGFTEQSSGNYVLQGNATVDALTVTGNTTLGDTSADSLTVNATSTFTGRVDIQQLFVNGVEVTGSGSTSASDITSGTLATNFGGTGVDGSLAPAGSLLIGTGAGYTLNTLTAGTGMEVSNGAGTITLSNTGVISITGTADQITASASTGDITLSLPQSISTTSTPTFAGATLNGNLMGTSATFSAGLTSDSLATGAATLTGTLTGTSAIFTGNLDGTTANFTGRVDAQSLFVNGVEVTGGGSVDRTAIDTALTYASDTGSLSYPEANLALGSGALAGQKRAGNVAIGEGVLGKLDIGLSSIHGVFNSGVGYQALYSNTLGYSNSAQGSKALYSNTTGYRNSAQGSAALYSNTTGYRNSAQGSAALYSNTTGYHNSAQGSAALYSNTTGLLNSAQGYRALYRNTTGSDNSAQGSEALYSNTTGYLNSAQGYRALYFNTTGRYNTGLGADANVLSGALDYATVIGADSQVSTSNTLVLGALGVNKDGNVSTTDDQIVIGATSRDDTTANTKLYVNGAVRINGALVGTSTADFAGGLTGTTANFTGRVDAQSLFVNGVEVTGGGSVTRSGIDTALTTASDTAATAVASMALGLRALDGATRGGNLAIGTDALTNTAVGGFDYQGAMNTALGQEALIANTTGFSNTATGYQAMLGMTSGYQNTGSGWKVLEANTTGHNNVAMGFSALASNTTGAHNTAIGAYANTASSGLNYASAIGGYARVATSDTVVLGALGANKDGVVSTTDDQVVIGAASRDDTTANTKLYVNGAVRINGALVGTSTANFAGGLTGTTANFTDRLDAQSLFVNGVEINGGVDRTAIDTALNYASDTGDVNYPESNLALGSGALAGPVRAGNVAIGAGVLGQISISATADNAVQNTGVGYQALYYNATGHRNSAIGYQSLFNNTGGNNNTAMGFHTMYSNSTGSSNVAIGRYALYSNTGGGGNTATGYDALYSNTTGNNNSAVGRDALYSNTTGDDNSAQGRIALYFNTTGSANVAIGRGALYSNTTGSYNTGLGRGANVTTGALNYASAVGGHSNVATSNTLVLGAISANKDALISTTDDQVVIGATSRDDTTANTKLYVNGAVRINGALVGTSTADFAGGLTGTTANFTGRVDAQSLFVNGVEVTGGGSVDRTAIDTALTYASDTGSGSYPEANLALGSGALAGQKRAGNVAIGEGVLGQLTSSTTMFDGTANTGVGYQALYSNTKGIYNSAQGYQALYGNTVGFGNSAQGYQSLYGNTTGANNSAQGYKALYSNTTGSYNNAQGYRALDANTTGSYNSAQGYVALYRNTTGDSNSAQGYRALLNNTTGSYNTGLGTDAGVLSGALNYATVIGADSKVSTSNTLVLGALGANKDGVVSTTDDQVVIGDTSRTGTHKLYVNGTALATSWNTTSDRRLKTDITVLEGDTLLSKLSGVQANRYRYISTPEAGYRIGVIAQDIAGLFPEVASTLGGEFYSVDYNALGAMAAAGVGRLYARQLDGEQTIATLRTDLDDLQAWQTGVSDRADAIQAALDANLAAIEANTTELTEQQLRLAAAESGIEKATADIAKNLEAINLNKTSLADNLALINTNKTGIERLDGEIVRLDGITSSNTAAIANNLGLIERNAESIASNLALITVNQQAIAVNTSGISKLTADVTAITNRVTANEEQIELNVQAIADNLVAITTNADAITRIDDVLLDLTDKTDLQQAAIDNINQRWGNVFDHNVQADTLTIKPGQLVVQNLLADSIQANSIRAQRIEAELAVLAALEVDNLSANVATANNLRAEQLNTGSKELYANAGSLIGLFNAQADGHYTVTVSSSNGQYATATVIVASGVARVVPLQNDGLEILATGTTVQVLGNDQMVKASWTRTG